jgi:hypothetical protein
VLAISDMERLASKHLSPELAHVFYAHSPITYSMALAVIERLHIASPTIIGGRHISGPRITRKVMDDGIWSIHRTVVLLRCIADVLPTSATLTVYLPHTAFLFGKLIKLSHRVAGIVYLEEGYTSAQASILSQATPPTQVNIDVLLSALREHNLIRDWQFDSSELARLNDTPERAFDTTTPKYAGAFACSIDAFVGMKSVVRVPLRVLGPRRTEHLLSFHALSNRHFDANLHIACGYVCDIIKAIALNTDVHQPQLIKLHPMDYDNLPTWFLEKVLSIGNDYFEHCQRCGLDPNVEPALLNFDHYYVIGQTVQTKYVANFLGPHRLTSFCGDTPFQDVVFQDVESQQ